jgi:hypothetical protein
MRRINLLLWPSIQRLDISTIFLSINNDRFHSYVDSIYPSELEIKDTIESSASASYLDVLLNIDAGGNIPLSPAYGVYTCFSQLIRYARACSTYDKFSSRGRLLTDKLIMQGFLQSHLMSAFRKFYGRYNDLIHNYKFSLSHMSSDIFHSNSKTALGTLTLTADNSAFTIMELGSWRV